MSEVGRLNDVPGVSVVRVQASSERSERTRRVDVGRTQRKLDKAGSPAKTERFNHGSSTSLKMCFLLVVKKQGLIYAIKEALTDWSAVWKKDLIQGSRYGVIGAIILLIYDELNVI